MSKRPKYWNRAVKYLSKKDPVMKKLISQYRDKTLTTRKDIFYSLCKSIIGQQISVAAANSVFSKFENIQSHYLLDNNHQFSVFFLNSITIGSLLLP